MDPGHEGWMAWGMHDRIEAGHEKCKNKNKNKNFLVFPMTHYTKEYMYIYIED